jgi:hypothetical protein
MSITSLTSFPRAGMFGECKEDVDCWKQAFIHYNNILLRRAMFPQLLHGVLWLADWLIDLHFLFSFPAGVDIPVVVALLPKGNITEQIVWCLF